MACLPQIEWKQRMNSDMSYMLVANHTSMLDIMLMLYVSKNPFVFVGKQELAKIPVFGFFYKKVCILVDRNNPKSRSAVYRSVRRRLEKGLSICIFPEAGVPEEDVILDEFKDGAFKIAITHKIPVVPIVFLDCKKRFPFRFFSGAPGKLRVVVHPFLETAGLETKDALHTKEVVRKIVLQDLLTEHEV